MQRAFSFPATLERSRTKERLEASLSGLCELELRRQRQECLVLGALALGEPLAQDDPRRELSCLSSWGQQNLTLRRQLNALQSSPWGLMQALEQQVGELRIDIDDGCCDGAQGDTGDSRPSSGFYESSEGQSPKGKPSTAELTETVPTHVYANDRPKSVADPLVINGEFDVQMPHPSLPRSFSAPHPPLEGIMEEGSAGDAWQWDFRGANPAWLQEAAEDHLTEEDYQQALRVEGYILSLVQRHTLSPRPCQPRTTLNPDPPHGNVSGHSSQHWRTPSHSAEQRLPDPHHQPYVDLLTNSKSHAWGCDLPEVGACRGEAQLFEKDCHLAPPYPQSRPNSLTGRLPSPLLSMDPNGSVGLPDLFCDPPSPQHYLCPLPPVPHNLVSAQYISGQSCQAPVRSPRHYKSEQPKPSRAAASPDHPSSKYKASKKGQSDRQRSKKTNSKTSRSQSENSLLAQRGLPERRYSTTERRQDKTNPSPNKAPAAGPQVSNNGRNNGRNNGHNGNRRWCSNLELSQDEAETQTSAQANKRPPRKIRHGHPCSHSQQQHAQRWHQDCQSRAPLGQGGEAYASAAAPPAESESSTSEVYTPASSSLSSDSDESGGLVWPQQLPPRLASTSSSSSPSPQAAASVSSHPKAFVKIKASHALKKKILRFRSGSLKVMTTV